MNMGWNITGQADGEGGVEEARQGTVAHARSECAASGRYYYASIFICTFATMAYFAMLSGQVKRCAGILREERCTPERHGGGQDNNFFLY